MKKAIYLLIISYALMSCQSDGQTKSSKQRQPNLQSGNHDNETKITQSTVEHRMSIPALPEANQYDGFIVYFTEDTDSTGVLTEIEKKIDDVALKPQLTLATGGVLIALVFPDNIESEAKHQRTQQVWQALHRHSQIITAEPNLRMTMVN